MLLALGTVDDKEKEGLSAGRRQYGCTLSFSFNSMMEYVPKMPVLSTDRTLYFPAGHQQGSSALHITTHSCPLFFMSQATEDQSWVTAWSLLCFLFLHVSSSAWPLSQSCLQFSPALSGGLTGVDVTCPVPLVCTCANVARPFPLWHCLPCLLISGNGSGCSYIRWMTCLVGKQLQNETYIDLKPHVKYTDICS